MSPLLKDFLNDYAAKIVFRANAHGAMDELADNLYPFVSQLQSTGKYAVDHKEMTVDHLNVLNNLYGFKNSTLTSPSKLPGWLKKCKKGSKNASD